MVKSAKKHVVEKDISPGYIQPMLCTLVNEPVDNNDYIYEQKWDGYRIIAKVGKSKVEMYSRSGLNYTSRYPLIAAALKSLGHTCTIDGEVVVYNEDGIPDFDALQLYNGKHTPIAYCVFDLLELDGQNLMNLPLYQRKELLQVLVEGRKALTFSESHIDGKALFNRALTLNLEGIVGKVKESPYIPGNRSSLWIKIPTRKRQEFVIGGWAESDRSRSFRSLLFGAYENGKLSWIGRSGGGYKQSEMPGILARLQAIETDESPFVNKVLDTKGAKIHWVKPRLVANFEFATWTKSGRIRKPATFLGFRNDKKPNDVVREVPKQATEVEKEIKEDVTTVTQKPHNAALDKYRDKRRFDQTPEPTGGLPGDAPLTFVVQKHHASHLHYDFRLEMRGVLKSWAVPKGPSMNPEDRRLAMAVEDHPFDYKDFEGIIPKGQYGGGTVIIWDNGTYEPEQTFKTKKEQEHWLLSGYYKGSLSIRLTGKKLKGLFHLNKARNKGDNSWFLTKVKDRYALKRDITSKGESVVSGLTIEQMAANNKAAVWNSNRTGNTEAIANAVNSVAHKKGHRTVGGLYPLRHKITPASNWKKIFAEPLTSIEEITVDGNTVVVTNAEKMLWAGVRKVDLMTYYSKMYSYILPYLKDRPLSLHIKAGLKGKTPAAMQEGFYIKDMEGQQPAFLDIFSTQRKHKKAGKRNTIDYSVCDNLAALLYLINLGCIDLNPWNSKTDKPLQPDYIAIDLDPSDNDFEKAIYTARAARDWLKRMKLKSFVKTSGKTGIHIFIPCTGFSFPQARLVGERICKEIHSLVPDITTLEVSKRGRGTKLFVDFSQNDEADTLACAYSVRPGKQPLVSTPLDWREVKQGLSPETFTIETIFKRMESKGDLWQGLFNKSLQAANSKILGRLL